MYIECLYTHSCAACVVVIIIINIKHSDLTVNYWVFLEQIKIIGLLIQK